MAQQNINIGSSANKGDGDPLRTAFTKINSNFTELYGKVTVLEGGGVAIQRDTQGSIFGDDSTLLVDAVNSLIPSSVLSGNLPALDGSALTNLTIPAQTFASLTGTPTTIVGYGISDAYTKAEVDSSIASVTAGHFDFTAPSGSGNFVRIVGYAIDGHDEDGDSDYHDINIHSHKHKHKTILHHLLLILSPRKVSKSLSLKHYLLP